MAVTNSMFVFEVVVSGVDSYIESKYLYIKSEFADIFSLELKDPKQMNIVIPEPPPLPPPTGKKGKKPPKPKKGKKGKEPPPPPAPDIQAGQAVLFSSNAEFLTQSMKKYPMEVSIWNKEDDATFIGATMVPWDPIFFTFLKTIFDCPQAGSATMRDDFNIFEEGTAKIIAKMGLKIKLTHIGEKGFTSFRTLSEDPAAKKFLYTGINSKTTSYMCTLKTTEEEFQENYKKIGNSYTVDKPPPPTTKKIVLANYKNVPGVNVGPSDEDDYCCKGKADKPPDDKYDPPETCPDINFIIDYIRKTIVSCNDYLRMLTPRPTLTPRVKATDIDRYCYCSQQYPKGTLYDKFKKETQSEPCAVCIDAGKKKKPAGTQGGLFDVANIRGPCGRTDCRIARRIRQYIEKLVEEDEKEIDINQVIGPCGSKTCTLAEKIQEFLRHEGDFKDMNTFEGLSTQCACVDKMRQALEKTPSCISLCSKDCKDSDSSVSDCEGKGCPFKRSEVPVYDVYYFTVEYDKDQINPPSGKSTPCGKSTASDKSAASESSKFQFCDMDCASVKASISCSKSICNPKEIAMTDDSKCTSLSCPGSKQKITSPADDDIVINFKDIQNPCCVKKCDIGEKVKNFIADNVALNKKRPKEEDPCYCDCVCDFTRSNRTTTYCGVCGGYEALGDDMENAPEHIKPHPCPIYHKLYDKSVIKTISVWPDEDTKKAPADNVSSKSSKTKESFKGVTESRNQGKSKSKKEGQKKVGKFTANVSEDKKPDSKSHRQQCQHTYPPVPKYMGWNWNAEDIPGMKPRPKWKPGAVSKFLLRKLRAANAGTDILAKKRRAMMKQKKKLEPKPTLVVTKKNGEYTVQMEVFKKYSKERFPHQYPYDVDKPPLFYKVGRTEEENIKLQKQRERRERRETRRKCRLLQSSFRDKCQEICLKAYNQAIGVLPLPNSESPECPCQTQAPVLTPSVDSCSCSEGGSISTSDTDGDEWEIQFTPPAAKFDPLAKHPPVLVENESQYTYLDYRVKLLDKQGNQIPRFFKGPDGKEVCSDLGGFWNHEHVWMEINKDGYIGPDGRWVPMNFYGPDGMLYSVSSEDHFTDSNGNNLQVGVDGYIDKDLKWVWYRKKLTGSKSAAKSTATRMSTNDKMKTPASGQMPSKDTKGKTPAPPPSYKDAKKQPPANKGGVTNTVSKGLERGNNPLIMSISVNYEKSKLPRLPQKDKMNIDPVKLAKYREIMKGLQKNDEFFDLYPPANTKANRASNTIRKNVLSPCTNYPLNSPHNRSNRSFTNSSAYVLPTK